MCTFRRRVNAHKRAIPSRNPVNCCAHRVARSRFLGHFGAFTFAFAFFALIGCAHGGVNIEDVPGVYRRLSGRRKCPASVTVVATTGVKAKLITSDTKCNSGEIVMKENPGLTEGNEITRVLLSRGVNIVGTIVLANVTKGITCERGFRVENVSQGNLLNFVRPRETLRYPDRVGTLYRKGQYYAVLRSNCIYYRESTVPGKGETAPSASPTPTPSAQADLKGESAAPLTQGKGATSTNPWAWAGPLIGIGALALVAIVALVVRRRGRQSGLDGESSENAFFGSLASSPRRSMHDTLARDTSGIVFEGANEESPREKSLPGPPSGLSDVSE